MYMSNKPSKKDFRLVIIGQIISVFGSSFLRFALSLYVLDSTGSSSMFATILAISNIPILLSPLGGAIADRFNRRDLMVIFDFTSSFIVLCLFSVMAFSQVSIFIIGVTVVLLAIVAAMYTPAVTASIPLLVEEGKLEGANGIVQAVQALSSIAAPLLGGVLYGIFSIKIFVLISCIAFFLSAVMEIFIKIPFEKREQKSNIITTILGDMKDGVAYVIKKSFIWKATVLATLLNLFLSPLFIVGAPIILRVTLKSSDTLYGVGMGLINFASILGALAVGVFGKKMKINTAYRWLAAIVIMLIPIILSVHPSFLGFGFLPSYMMFMTGAVLIAIVTTILSIFIITKAQIITPNENLGKVMAIIMAVAQCAAPVGQLLYGLIFESFKSALFLPVAGVCVVMLGITVLSGQMLKNEDNI